ncbi:NuA4-domain-containing protein [Irpex rosettiformis]|uniref:NuA4-domain-containing protein n=1 Tax=Irpex rosettiformis TaxID=378272 RepID=A0ACB8U0S4_9APHY|nr:NuA4-domain-containing protein [Irpex rosettiformis]
MAAESVPTAEEKAKYDGAKKELLQAISKKRQADKQLAGIEVQIYNLESAYLMETASHSGGNIVQGFDGYLKNPPGGRRKYEVSDADRLFSSSSVSYKKSLELSGEGEESAATGEDQSRMSTPGLTTVVLPAAKATEMTAAQQKKHRDREYQRKKRANAARRSAALSDEESVTSASSRRPTKRSRIADDD